jgi:hypothetical protein
MAITQFQAQGLSIEPQPAMDSMATVIPMTAEETRSWLVDHPDRAAEMSMAITQFQAQVDPDLSIERQPAIVLNTAGPRYSRPNYHPRCTQAHHRGFMKQQRQCCRQCIHDTIFQGVRSGMAHFQIMQAVRLIAKSYWCPFCLEGSVAAMSTSGAFALRLFRSCKIHRHHFLQKRCPCGKPWAACLACMDNRVDPRAGTSFCADCRLRFGAVGATASVCRCRCLPQDEPADGDIASTNPMPA